MLPIAIIGYGKMGRMVQDLAAHLPVQVVSLIDPHVEGCEKEISATSLKDARVCIDFTYPACAADNILRLCALQRNIVIGTTGWTDRLTEVKSAVEKAGIGMVYGSNLSIGMNLFYEIVQRAAEVFDNYPEYDVFGLEMHHRQKVDSPSGTAKELGNLLIEKIKHKHVLQAEKLDRKINPEELHFVSVRGGCIPGTHTISFDSEADTIELTHRVRNRTGFALSALKAALWIAERQGLFTFRDFIRETSL